MEDEKKLKKIEKKKEKQAKKKEKKETRDYVGLKRKAKVIMFICLGLIVIELIIMLFMHLSRDNKLEFIDSLYSVINVDENYYVAVGSSNFKHSKYNDSFTYEYEDGIFKGQINKVYAEQAKIVKYDKELNLVFEKTFKGDYDSCFYDVKAVKDGFIAVGSYVLEKEQLSINTRDGLIVKYDLDGNEVWHKNFQILGDTEFKSVLILDDGILAVGQSIYENFEIGNHTIGGGIIVKFDFDGNEIWRNNFGGNKSGIFEDVVLVDDGYIVCGKDAKNTGLLVKFDLKGDRKWYKNYQYTDTYGMYDIEVKDNKLYVATGISKSTEKDKDGNSVDNYDAAILVYDMNGELVDTYSIGGNYDDRFNSLMLLDDKIIAIGYTMSSDIKIDGINYKKDEAESIIVSFDYNGKILDSKVYGGDKNDILSDIVLGIKDLSDEINNTESYVIVGYTNSKRGLFNGNGKDYFAKILKYNKKLELVTEK